MVKMSVDWEGKDESTPNVVFSIPNGYSDKTKKKMQKLLLDTIVRLNRIYFSDPAKKT